MNDIAVWLPVCASFVIISGRVKRRHLGLTHLAEHVKIIAHRGASHLAPENTLASINLAWELGADAVEVDVHLTHDKRIVAIHDPTTKRTAGTEMAIAASHSEHLRRLDVGHHKHGDFVGESIPFLEEVLATVPPERHLFVEIKCSPRILPPLDEMLTSSGKRSQIVLIGFDLETMRAAKELMPDVPAYWLCDKQLWRPYRGVLAQKARAAGLDGLNVHWSGITRRFVAAVKAAGLKLYTWTVDDPADAARLRALGVDGITTNRPGWLRSRIAAASAPPQPADFSAEQTRA